MPLPSGLHDLMIRRTLVWPLLAMPAVFICYWFLADLLSYGESIHITGQWSVGLLCAALLATPFKRLLPKWSGSLLLLRHRRAIGVASFGYALLHTVIYLDKKWAAGLVLKEGQDPSLLTGWIAFLLFLALAATSNNMSVRKLDRRWKGLHRSVYLAAALTFIHWALTSLDPTTAISIGASVFIFELIRIQKTQKPTL